MARLGSSMYSSYSGSDYSEKELKAEISQLKFELGILKKEMNKFHEFMKTNGSFTDFKVFKFNEEEELRQKELEKQRLRTDLYSRFGT